MAAERATSVRVAELGFLGKQETAAGTKAHAKGLLSQSKGIGPLRAVQTATATAALTRTLFKWLVWAGIIFFVIGPGATRIFQIISETAWYWWIAAIFVLIIILRRFGK